MQWVTAAAAAAAAAVSHLSGERAKGEGSHEELDSIQMVEPLE